MASLTRSQLKTSSNNTYDTNGVGGITAAEARLFNNDLIDSLITNDLTSSMVVLSASFASNAGTVGGQTLTSLNQFTASQDTKNSTLASYTGSNDITNTAQNNRLTNLESKSASVDISITNINQFTASNGNTSLNQFTSSADNRLNNLETTSASVNISISNLNSTTASQGISISNLNAATSSYAISSSVAAVDAAQQSQINSLIAASGSYLTSSTSLQSLNSFTQSQYVSNSFFATTGSNTFNGDQTINGNVSIIYSGNTTFDVGELKITGNNGRLKLDGASGATLRLNGIATSGMNDFDITTSPISNTGSVIFQNANNSFIFARFDSTDKTTIYNKLDVSGSVSITGSLTASIQQGYAWVGNANGVSVAVATSSFAGGASTDITALNAFTASQDTKNSTLATYTGSNDTKWNTLGTQTGSFITETESGSFLITASVNLNTITFTKGNNTTFAVTVNTGSATSTDITALNSFTASQDTKNSTLATYTASVDTKFSNIGSQSASWDNTNLNSFTASQDTKNSTIATYTGSNDTKWSNLGSQSGSFVTESETGSFARTNVNNNFSVNQTFTNITAVSASFQYIQTTYETASVIYSSGSNQFGDELTDIQTLSGSVKVQGSLTVNGTPVQTGSADITSLNAFTASQETKNSTLATYTASVNISLTNINSFTSSNGNTSLNSYTASNNTKWNTLGGQTGSFVSVNTSNTFTQPQIINYSAGTGSLFTTDRIQTELPSFKESGYRLKNQFGNTIIEYGQQNSDDSSGYLVVSNSSGSQTIALNGKTGNLQSLTINTQQLTASLQQGYVWVGNASNVSSLVATSSFGGAIPAGTISSSAQISTLGFVSSSVTASSLITASVSSATITFTKGDNTQFSVTVATGSFVSASYAQTASLAINAKDIIVDVKNTTGAQINIGTVVRIIGATGDNPLIGTASWENDSVSANTLGFVVANIANDSFGRVMTQGTLLSVNTDPVLGYTAGQLIYLSSSGQFTNVPPPAPFHEVRLGQVLRAQQNNGSIYVLVQNGYELSELHDVNINTGSLANNNLLAYNSTSQQWENKTLTEVGATTSASFNSYTASNDQKVNSLISATGSYVTSAITASSLITASVSLNTITFTKGDASTFSLTVDTGSGGGTLPSGLLSSSVTNFVDYSASVDSRINGIVAGTGFATTGSNTFRGNETFEDAAGNASTLVPTSGSLMLVAKSYTSASSHISGTTNLVNLIFKNNDNTADTIISGSANMFINPAAPTAGFKRYVGGSGNIMLNASNVPQISSSMAFSPTMNNNHFGGNSVGLIMRGPVSSSTYTISGNSILGTVSIGSSDANHARGIQSGFTLTGNNIAGTLTVIANRENLSSSVSITNTSLNGGATINANSSSVSLTFNNINDSAFTLNNNYFTGSAGVGQAAMNRNNIGGQNNVITIQGSQVAGTTNQPSLSDNTILGGGAIIFSDVSSARVSTTNAYHSAIRNIIGGNQLIISGSSLLADASSYGSAYFGRWNVNDGIRNKTSDTVFAVGTGTATGTRKTGFLIDSGSNTFIEGTLNVSGATSLNGNLNITGSLTASLQQGFVYVGNASGITTTVSTSSFGGSVPAGTVSSSAQILNYGIFATTGSNSFNGNQTITGSITLSGSIVTIDRSGNNTNAIIGLNAMGMGAAGAQPLAINNQSSVAIGNGAMRYASGSQQNVAIGPNALSITSGSNNFALGSEAMASNLTGNQNVAIGVGSMNKNTTGNTNVVIGNDAGFYNVSGSSNTFIGASAGNNIFGNNNVIIGRYQGTGEILSNNIILADGSGTIKAQYSGSAWSFQDGIKLNVGSNKTTDVVSVNATLTVSNSLVTANSIILVTTQNSTTGPVYPAVVTSKGAGTFSIAHNFGGNLDVAYLIINPT
jgi:uncharacterized coiled-coil protein SlyX